MGSPEDEPLRKPDEGPVQKVTLSKFWMAKTEVTWDEYMAFFRATGSQGRTEGQVVTKKNVDAISGATPPWGAPDQGWGKGSTACNNNVVACSKCILPVVIESHR